MTQSNHTNWKNVNNWHWVDKNCLPWAETYFKKQLTDSSATFDGITVTITSVKVNGDCDLNQRKGQIISIFDLSFKLQWSGTNTEGVTATGTIEIPEFMHDTKPKEIVLDISVEDGNKEKEAIKQVVRTRFGPHLCSLFEPFTADLMNGSDV
jgi:activator of HSP90 ATPase